MKLKLIHFFPDKLNLYGDRGNIITLQKRCQWRGIDLEITEIKHVEGSNILEGDILFIGGGSDREQALCTAELFIIKDDIKTAIEDGVSMLAICGGYQFLGTHYITADGTRLEGLGILDIHTENKGERIIGNLLVKSENFGHIVGFENHGGRTYHNYPTLGAVVFGGGNNGEDGKEGIMYKNLIGTYLHGPLLPKNPMIADVIIQNAITRKYGRIEIAKLEDKAEKIANDKLWTLYSGK